MRKFLFVAAALLLPLLVGLPAAQAQISQVCGNTGTGYCINAWNGGPSVKMYYGGYSNDSFAATPVFCVQRARHGPVGRPWRLHELPVY